LLIVECLYFLYEMEEERVRRLLVFYKACGKGVGPVIEILAAHLSLQLYVESGASGMNCMLSGESFVIDLIYNRKAEERGSEERVPDGVSICSASTLLSNEAGLPGISLGETDFDGLAVSLVEDAWERHFVFFSAKLRMIMALKDYPSLFSLLKEFVKADSGGFSAICAGAAEAEKRLSGELRDTWMSYAFERWKEVVVTRNACGSLLFGDVSEGGVSLLGAYFSPSEWMEFVNGEERFLRVVGEAYILGIPGRLDKSLFRLELDGKKRIVITRGLLVLGGESLEADDEATVLLKRGVPLYDILKG
jgi:hypothetical protein